MGGTIRVKLAAFLATIKNHKAMTRVGLCADRLHCTATRIGAITGIDIYMHAPKTKGAMIARGKAKCLNLTVTMKTRKAVIVF